MLRRLLAIAYEISSYQKETGKPIWRSKTIWVNAVSLIALLSSKYIGVELSSEEQVSILTVINFILRLITKEETGLIMRDTPIETPTVLGNTADG